MFPTSYIDTSTIRNHLWPGIGTDISTSFGDMWNCPSVLELRLNTTYCPPDGGTGLRITTLQNTPYQISKFRGYRSGIDFRIDIVELGGVPTDGSALITCEGVSKYINFDTDINVTATNFATNQTNIDDYYIADVSLSNINNVIYFTGKTAGVDFTVNDTSFGWIYGDMYATVNLYYGS